MKVLHAAHLPFWSGGIVQQMSWESQAARDLGLDWHPRIFLAADAKRPKNDVDEDVFVSYQPQQRRLDFRRAYYEWLRRSARYYDLVLLRYSTFNPLQLRFLLTCPVPVLTVHHTLEIPELKGLRNGRIKAVIEQILGRRALSTVKGVVSVTREIAEYEVSRAGRKSLPKLLYPNGTQMPRPMAPRSLAEPYRLLFIASRFFPWHGLDRLIETCRQTDRHFHVDIVGEVEEADRIACERDSRFVLHGTQDSAYIAELSERASLSLSSFALDRKGMEEACTLKVREALGAGLAVYSGHRDVFPSQFPFYRSGPCDIENILDFADEAARNNPSDVADAARPYIEKRQLLGQLYNDLELLVGQRQPAT